VQATLKVLVSNY